jgi:hypothetical protein
MRRSKEVTTAAQSAGSIMQRFAAVETEARRIFEQQKKPAPKQVRAVLNGSLHILITDGKATMEVNDGVVALHVVDPARAE